MRRISTIESVEARELSLLAVFEVVFAVGAYMTFAYCIESALPFVIAVSLAPLFLLRTDDSVAWTWRIYGPFADRVDAWWYSKYDLDGSWARKVVVLGQMLAAVSLLVVSAMVLRAMATAVWAVRAPLAAIKAIPGNWYQQTFCVDFKFPPELVPGETVRHLRSAGKIDSMLLQLLNFFRDPDLNYWEARMVAAVSISPPLLIAYGMMALYRISL